MVSLRIFSAFIAAYVLSLAHGYSSSTSLPSRQHNVADSSTSLSSTESVSVPSSRRSFFCAVSTVFRAGLVVASNPLSAVAAAGDDAFQKKEVMPLETYLYTVARVREATQQEMRLIRTGKFKDVARGNVKLAVRFMLNNYRLSDNVIAAASYLKGQQAVQAGGDGQKAVQSLYTILEYFDASGVENIKVDSLAGKEQIVLNGLEAAQKSIDQFLSYFPKDVVDKVCAKIDEENALNAKEFDSNLGVIINPNPVTPLGIDGVKNDGQILSPVR